MRFFFSLALAWLLFSFSPRTLEGQAREHRLFGNPGEEFSDGSLGTVSLCGETEAFDKASPDSIREVLPRAIESIDKAFELPLDLLIEATVKEDQLASEAWKERISGVLNHSSKLYRKHSFRLEDVSSHLHSLIYQQCLELLGNVSLRPVIAKKIERLNEWFLLLPKKVCDPFSLPETCRKENADRLRGLQKSESIFSLFFLNTESGKKRILNGDFDLVFRGTDMLQTDFRQSERLAIGILLEDPDLCIGSYRFWKNFMEWDPTQLPGGNRLQHAIRKTESGRWISLDVRTGHFEKMLFDPVLDPRTRKALSNRDYLFVSRHYRSAALFGPVIFAIFLAEPRGLDLNTFLRENHDFYRTKVPSEKRLSLKGIWGNIITDFDELLLASYIPAREVVGCDIRPNPSPLPPQVSLSLKKPGPLLRRYHKRFFNDLMWLDVLDGENRLVGFLSTDRRILEEGIPAKAIPRCVKPGKGEKGNLPEILRGLRSGGKEVLFLEARTGEIR